MKNLNGNLNRKEDDNNQLNGITNHTTIYEHCEETLEWILPKLYASGWCVNSDNENSLFPYKFAIICGSGHGHLSNILNITNLTLSYADIPNFCSSSVIGHANKLIFGSIYSQCNGQKMLLPIIILAGRIHCYEGFSTKESVYPLIISRLLGACHVLISNSSGGINKNYKKGDVMILKDHINFPSIAGGLSSLVGPLLDSTKLADIVKRKNGGKILGLFQDSHSFVRFPNASRLYDRSLSQKLYAGLLTHFSDNRLHAGNYFYNFGPSYETPSEVEAIRRLGGDAVGMSTLPEVIMACQLEMKIVAFALITNECVGTQESSIQISETENSDKFWLTQLDNDPKIDSYIGPTHFEVIQESSLQASNIAAAVQSFLTDVFL